MKHARIFLFCASMIVMGCCNFLIGKSLTDITLNTNGISKDSLIEMSKEPYMVPYVKYLMKADIPWEEGDMWFYTLVFIDDDEIPEMIVRSNLYYALDGLVMSQYDGVVSSIEVLKEVQYIERSGLLKNYWSNVGGSMDRVFQLKNGQFELTATMQGEDNFENPGVRYYFNGKEVDEETAEKLLKEAFEDKGSSIFIDDLEWMDWNELLKHKESIKGWK